ncbi:MAG: hypothetical protein FJZ47_17355 [Candidatus Tectomicrobia bacterium]|uniref:FimV N-terminal domain-containing protein n=1 Tax=Tectimicrobiota bacterium TaxID=2528274 RepID=A0A937W3J2_UNCTE|nr:hypothetical protein [Candidatus Tectomicrobia bacterium]
MQQRVRVVIGMLGLQLALVSGVWAFAVGDITVLSRRGDPFAAEIRLHLEARERDKEIEVTLGTHETYRSEGVKRPAVIDILRAAVAPGQRDVIRLSSAVALQVPAFELVLAVRAGQLTIVKHYHVVIPAALPATARAVAPTLPSIAPVVSAGGAKAPAKPTRSAPRRTERYGPVERGETLYSIAKSLRLSQDKVWPAVVVIWRANKGQFQGGNIHGLQVGTFLDIPADLLDSAATLRLQEAQELVADQWEEWQTVQRAGTGKQRVITAARQADTPNTTRREAAARRDGTPPVADKQTEKSLPIQAMVLPVGKGGNMVSMTELQNMLQGLEDRLLRRMTPTSQTPSPVQTQPQEIKSSTGFVSASDLQTSIQSLEERLTQRMQQMLTPAPEPIRVGQQHPQQTFVVAQPLPTVDTSQSLSLVLMPYLLVFTNVALLLLAAGLVWLWLRRRERIERMQRI